MRRTWGSSTILGMDLSKLPRLSGDQKDKAQATPQPEPETKPPAERSVEYYGPQTGRDAAGAGPEIWLLLVVGIILMLVGRKFARWAFAAICGQTFDSGVKWVSGPNTGQMVPYWQIVGHEALSDCAMFLFGLAMALEGAAMAVAIALPRSWQGMYFASFLVSIVMTICNVVAAAVLLGDGTIPLISMLAVGFGGYMAMTQWSALRRASEASRA